MGRRENKVRIHLSVVRPVLLGALLLVSGTLCASAAEQICLAAKDAANNPVDGGFAAAQCSDQIEVVEFHHLVESERGSPVLRKVIFTKLIDDATVDLYRAWDRREKWAELSFGFFSQGGGGALTLSQTIKLQGVQIADIELLDSEETPEGAAGRASASERIRVVFDTITVIDESNGDQVTLQR